MATSEPAFSYPLMQGYGPTTLTNEPSLFGFTHFHNGLDFAAPSGTPVYAQSAGIVSNAGSDATGIAYGGPANFGNRVLVKLQDGFSTLFGHLSSIVVSPGQSVLPGQLLGYTGSTGNSTGPHLHYGVYGPNGQAVSPYALPAITGQSVGAKLTGSSQGQGQVQTQAQTQAQTGAVLANTPWGAISLPYIDWTPLILAIIAIVIIIVGVAKTGPGQRALKATQGNAQQAARIAVLA